MYRGLQPSQGPTTSSNHTPTVNRQHRQEASVLSLTNTRGIFLYALSALSLGPLLFLVINMTQYLLVEFTALFGI